MKFSEADLWDIYSRSLAVKENFNIPGPLPGQNLLNSHWTLTLNECIKTTSQPEALAEDKRNRQVYEDNFPLPFEEILLPFMVYGRNTLIAQVKEDYRLLDEPAHISVERSLLDWLAYVNLLPMQLGFSTFRASSQTSLSRLVKPKNQESSSVYYDRFIQHLFDGAFLEYFREYAVLARLLSTGVELWVKTVAELIGRFKKDKVNLGNYFNHQKELEKIMDIKLSHLDRRDNGRSVMVLSFGSGLKIVYKPRNLGIEKAYNRLISWLNALGSPVDLKSFKVLDLDDYGWAEFVTDKPVQNQFEAQAYYQRTGALLCLVHLLGATDLHPKNLIGYGEFPVLIDLETLLHPIFPEHFGNPETESANKKDLMNSVLRTGFLPYWQWCDEGQAIAMDGLEGLVGQEYHMERIGLENINTDHMQIQKHRINISTMENNNTSPNNHCSFHGFIDETVQGFSEMYTFLMVNSKDILSSSYWNALSKIEVRYIFRPTIVYTQIRQNLLHPEFLRNGIDRSHQLDLLKKGMTQGEASSKGLPLIDAELDALEKLDIPHFSVYTDAESLVLPGGKKVNGYFDEPSFVTASNRLEQLNKQDLQRQVEIIRESMGKWSNEEVL